MEQTLKAFEQTQLKKLPQFNVGDTIAVHTLIREGNRTRTQIFLGLVIAISGKGATKTFTVRKISYGVGVEKIFPFNSTNIAKIEIIKHGKTRRSKLYYLRDRVGKAALKVRPGRPVVVTQGEPDAEVLVTEETIETPTAEATENVEAETNEAVVAEVAETTTEAPAAEATE